MSYADVVEGVRAAIAEYTHALDDGRTDDVVAMFCADGTFELVGTSTSTGHDELRATYASWAPKRPQRHLVSNTLVTDWDDHEATAVSDVVLMVEGSAGWSTVFVARYRDVLHRREGRWRFHRRTVG